MGKLCEKSDLSYSSLTMQGYLNGPPDMDEEDVAVIKLDDMFESGYLPDDLQIDILKVDAEGYEMGVLRGAEKALLETRVHYLIIEYWCGRRCKYSLLG